MEMLGIYLTAVVTSKAFLQLVSFFCFKAQSSRALVSISFWPFTQPKNRMRNHLQTDLSFYSVDMWNVESLKC